MKDQLFDRQLKEMLDRLDEPYQPETWDALSKKLDKLQDPPPVDAVDKVVYNTLQQLEARYEASHWTAMSRQLDVIRRRTLMVRITKTLEAAAVILLLIRFTPDLVGAAGELVKGHSAEARSQPKSRTDMANQPINTVTGATEPSLRAETPARPLAQVQLYVIAPADVVVAPLPPADAAGFVAAETGASIHFPTPDINEWTPQTAVDSSSAITVLAPLVDLLPDSLSDAFDYMSLIPLLQKSPGYSPFYFSASIFGEINRFRTTEVTLSDNGYGTTAAVGHRGKRWHMEAGLGYAHKQYTPKRSVEIYDGNLQTGYFGTTMAKASADVLQLPIRFLRSVGQKGRLKILAGGGITPNVILNKQYDYDAVYYEAPQGAGPSSPLSGNTPKRSLPGKGVLEGGNWKDNQWTTADLALQFVWYAGKKNSFFLQPVFHFATDKVNLGNEPVQNNSFSVQAGVQTAL